MEEELCDLKININGQHIFFLNQRALCSYSGRVKKMVKQSKKRAAAAAAAATTTEIKIMDFPGGPDAFELISRFCYNNGRITMSPSNISLLHSSAVLLEMTEDISPSNLLTQADTFLDGLFYWTWADILASLRACEPFFATADSSGLLLKLISCLLTKISEHSVSSSLTEATPFPSSPPSSSSPDSLNFRRSSSTRTPESFRHSFAKEWWFDDLTTLPPRVIERMIKTLGAYGSDNKNLILTRFLLHYLRRAGCSKSECGGLADTAVHGVVLMGRAAFSCRGLFWVLRVVSGFGLSKECRQRLERVIGLAMDQATLDDLLVSGSSDGVYDVSLVMRLIRVFVGGCEEEESGVALQRLKKVGRLVDKYLREISPDQNLKAARFLGVAESLPDSARDCFDAVYRALDIYIESHPTLSSEVRGRLCRCLNYEKLTLETCRDLAKNPRIPPAAAIQALVSQQSKVPKESSSGSQDSVTTPKRAATMSAEDEEEEESASSAESSAVEKEELKINLQKMQNRVNELEKVCMEMKSQMSKMVKGRDIISSAARHTSRGLARFC